MLLNKIFKHFLSNHFLFTQTVVKTCYPCGKISLYKVLISNHTPDHDDGSACKCQICAN